ncbi:MAG: glycerophosphodiester phosphodiesterase [Myxococcales bacterium]|nr:glycerophosphodiester phosphodiesterase [Myxococcales bacterium]
MIAPSLARLIPALGRARRGGHLWRRDRPIVWAHRGVSAHATENTLPAFALAAAHGADGIELDVMPCATGEIVVFHDDDLRRLAGRPERIDALPWSALAAVELTGGGRVPRLEQALEAAGDLLVNVELKVVHPGRPGPLPAAVAAILADVGRRDRLVVSSFDPVALWQFHLAAPQISLGFLFELDVPAPWRAIGALLGASSLHVQHDLCTPSAVAGWRARGFAVHAWTVDDPARLRALAAAGLDGVFSNDPRAARAALAGR